MNGPLGAGQPIGFHVGLRGLVLDVDRLPAVAIVGLIFPLPVARLLAKRR